MIPMTQERRDEITQIAKEFASGFEPDIPIAGSRWLIVDPLSGYLNAEGYKNEVSQLPANEHHPQVLILVFEDGSWFIPAGGDLKPLDARFENYMWAHPDQ